MPTALAFLSTFLQRPVPNTLASSGALVCEAHDVIVIAPIGDAEQKVKAAYHRNLRTLLLPHGNRADLERSTVVPRAISGDIGAPPSRASRMASRSRAGGVRLRT